MADDLDLGGLERLAKAATPGPWEACEHIVYLAKAGGFSLHDCPSPEANAELIVAAVNALPALITRLRASEAATAKAVERALAASQYLCRLEGALLADDLDMKLLFDEPSPTAIAEQLSPGFDAIAYDLARAALPSTPPVADSHNDEEERLRAIDDMDMLGGFN